MVPNPILAWSFNGGFRPMLSCFISFSELPPRWRLQPSSIWKHCCTVFNIQLGENGASSNINTSITSKMQVWEFKMADVAILDFVKTVAISHIRLTSRDSDSAHIDDVEMLHLLKFKMKSAANWIPQNFCFFSWLVCQLSPDCVWIFRHRYSKLVSDTRTAVATKRIMEATPIVNLQELLPFQRSSTIKNPQVLISITH